MLLPASQRTATTADRDELLDVDTVIFDFDGTLYEGTDFVAPHLKVLQKALGGEGDEVARAYDSVRAGEETVQLGDLFHFATGTILRPVPEPPDDRFGLRIREALTWDGHEAGLPDEVTDGHAGFDAAVTYVGDPWQIAAAVSHALGIGDAARRQAFADIRVVMNRPDYDLGIPACLPDLLGAFGHVRDRIMITNTPEELGREAADRVGVEHLFTGLVFGAAKPVGLAKVLAERIDAGTPADRILCVGDNYWNDVVPALQMGCRSVLIDPFQVPVVSELPLHLSELTELYDIVSDRDRAGSLAEEAR